MACDLTKGRLVDCKDAIGGLKQFWIIPNYCDNIESCAEITDLECSDFDFADWTTYGDPTASKQTLLQYDLRPNLSSLSVTFNSDPATGTTFWTHTLSVTLQKLDHDTTNQLKLAAYNRSQIFVRDANDNIFLLGMNNGCNISAGTMQSGAAKGDLSGYTLEFTAEEKLPPIQVTPTDGPAETNYPWDNLDDTDYSNIEFVVGT